MLLRFIWSFVMPFALALFAAIQVKKRLFTDKSTHRAIMKAKEVIMSERELQISKESAITRYVLRIMTKIKNVLDLEHIILSDIRNMLNQMGHNKTAENELAGYVVYSMTSALPVIAVPFITGYCGYIALYPVAVGIVFYRKYMNLKKQYLRCQTELVKDLPDLIDKLRISFASGRNYIPAFVQAREYCGPGMRNMLDKLVNDLQCMRPAQALDIFADAFKLPFVTKFASAVKIAVEYGNEAAENYFRIIENDILEVRRLAIEELTKTKPEKVYELYLLLVFLAAGALLIKGWEIFSQVSEII